jgi:hypothetical protein
MKKQLSLREIKKQEYVSGTKTYENPVETDKNTGENANDFVRPNVNKS